MVSDTSAGDGSGMAEVVVGVDPVLPQWDDNTRRGRYGVAYVHAVCSQAGAAWSETSPDEDREAIDGAISLGPGSVNVQIKCTSTSELSAESATISLKPSWVESWKQQLLAPTFIVVVRVPQGIPDWIAHLDDGTMHRTAAHWAQFDPAQHTKSITVPRSQRFTIETLHQWRRELADRFQQLRSGHE